MKIFILDDMVERQNTLLRLLKDVINESVIFVADSRDTAIEILKNENDFDIMFLDHDLGGKVYVDSLDPNTGWWVAKYIADNNIRSKQIIIHTLNYAGAKMMLYDLPGAKHIPFPTLVNILKGRAITRFVS